MVVNDIDYRGGAGVQVHITEWATDSYFDLVVSRKVISRADYKSIIRPDVELLKPERGLPLQNQKFKKSTFWGPATSLGKAINNSFKMKWHNFGSGKFQLRPCIGIIGAESFLCRAYVKDDKTEKREMAIFKIHMQRILNGKYTKRGVL
jgi:hypothetical protein